MKKTKILSILTVMLALSMSACNLFNSSSEQSSDEPTSSSVESSSVAISSSLSSQSSSAASSSSSRSSSSSSRSSSSSVAPSSSSVAPSSSSVAPSSSSEAPAEPVMAVSDADFIKEADVEYLNFTGTISGFANADAMKMAFGLVHKDATASGLADPLDGQWLVGSAEPVAADYKYVPTVTAGEFVVNIPLTEITFVKGAYDVYIGAQGHYAKVSLAAANWGSGSVKTGGLKVILRGDRSQIFAEELPDIALTEATTFVEGEGVDAKVFIQVGGELGLEPEVFQAKTVKVTFERQVGGWAQTVMLTSDATPLVTLVVDGTKGYVKANITALGLGGYQVKLGFDGTSAPNTVMDTESYDKRDNPAVLGNKEYAPYFAAGANDAAHLYGCCGLFIETVATQITQDTTRLEAENATIANATITAKGEDTAVSGESYLAGMTKTSGWNGKTSSADYTIKVPETSDYIVNIAYKCAATTTSALSLVVDGGTAIAIGTVAEQWTVVSQVINLTSGVKHTISVRGVSSVTSQLDYIELVKHNHAEGLAFNGEAVVTEGADAVTGENPVPALVGYTTTSCTLCSKKKLSIDPLDARKVITGSLKADTNYPSFKLNANNDTATYNLNLAAAVTGKLYFLARMDGYPSNATAGYYYQSNPSFEVKVGETVVDLSPKASIQYQSILGATADPAKANYSIEALVEIGNITLAAGLNVLTYKRLTTKNLLIKNFVIIY